MLAVAVVEKVTVVALLGVVAPVVVVAVMVAMELMPPPLAIQTRVGAVEAVSLIPARPPATVVAVSSLFVTPASFNGLLEAQSLALVVM
jgi:hypothetical protein